MTFSFVKAKPVPTINVVASDYGMFQGAGRSHSRARIWVLVDDASNFPQLRIAYNSPVTGKPVWEDIGEVASIATAKYRWDVTMADGSAVRFIPAPCVCGAGAVGSAGPSGEGHRVQYVRSDQFSWLTQV